MDPVSLAGTLTAFLAPLLPYLLKGGEKAAEEVGEKFGSVVWNKASALWARLRPRLEARPGAEEVVQELAQTPEDQASRGALELQVRKILAEDSNLAQEAARWLEEAQRAGAITIITTASGERSVAIGGKVTGGTIITGNGNR
jgi:hypothetical protein